MLRERRLPGPTQPGSVNLAGFSELLSMDFNAYIYFFPPVKFPTPHGLTIQTVLRKKNPSHYTYTLIHKYNAKSQDVPRMPRKQDGSRFLLTGKYPFVSYPKIGRGRLFQATQRRAIPCDRQPCCACTSRSNAPRSTQSRGWLDGGVGCLFHSPLL